MGVYKRGKVWYISYMVDGRQKKEKVCENKKIAEQALLIRKAEVAQGKFRVASKRRRVLFRDFGEEFLVWIGEHRKPETLRRYRTSMKALVAYFGHRLLGDIHPFHIEGYKSKRIEAVQGATVNRDLACLKRMFNLAIKWEQAKTNPARDIEFYTESKQSIRFLSENEASLLLSACKDQTQRLFVLIGLHAGLRYKEILSLKWSHINLDDRILVVSESKNNKAAEIPMTNDIHEALNSAKRFGDFVISKGDGTPYVNFRKQWNQIIQQCGLKDCTPHVLRHTFATELVRSGADLMAIKELGRWSSLELVQRYAHVSKDHRTRVIHLLNNKFKSYPTFIPTDFSSEIDSALNY